MPGKDFSVIAILYPKKGKADQVVEMLNDVAKYVRDNEAGVLKYEINRSLRPAKDGTEEIIMIERYQDQETLKLHGSSQPFTAFQKKLKELDLMRAPMLLKMVSPQGGFSSRL